jgi:hypothetical protein
MELTSTSTSESLTEHCDAEASGRASLARFPHHRGANRIDYGFSTVR